MTEDQLELAILEKFIEQYRKAETTTPRPADKCAWELDIREVLGELTGEHGAELVYSAGLWLDRLAPVSPNNLTLPLRRCTHTARNAGEHQFYARAFRDPTNEAPAPAWDRIRALRQAVGNTAAPRAELDQKFGILFSPVEEKRHFDSWRAATSSQEFSLGALFVDIDNFKALNTKHTEMVVDQSLLPDIQSMIKALSTHRGAAFKHGGDEYVVLLPNHSADETVAFAEKLRLAFAGREFRIGTATEKITVSIGAAVWPFHGQTLTDVLSAANTAEHASKAQGRNRVTMAPGISLKAPDQVTPSAQPPDLDAVSRSDEGSVESAASEMSTTAYIVQLYEAAALRDVARLKKLYDEIKLDAKRTISDERLESLYLKLRLDTGDQYAIADLETLAARHEGWINPLSELADYCKSIGECTRALKYSEQARARARSEQEKVFTAKQHAEILAADDRGEVGIDLINQLIEGVGDRALRASLYDTLADINELRGDRPRFLLSLERGLREEPESQRRRFRAAHAYSNSSGDQLLALHHYQTLLRQDRRYGYALNNLAHTYGELGLTGEKVSALEEAERFQAPLPTRNIASALAEAGFYAEARRRLGDLEDRFKFDKGVVSVLRDIQSREGSEVSRLAALSAGARQVHKRIAEALDRIGPLGRTSEKLAGEWRARNITLTLSVEPSASEMLGAFVIEDRTLSPAFFGTTIERRLYSVAGRVIDGIAILDVTPDTAEGNSAQRGSTILTRYVPPEKRLWAYLRESDELLVVTQDKNYGITETAFSRAQ